MKVLILGGMDGRGRALNNVFFERLWRSLKYEAVYLNEYESVRDARSGIHGYLRFYNEERLHQSLNYKTPGKFTWTDLLEFTGGNAINLGSRLTTLNKTLSGLLDGGSTI